ncbi:helix-turn-helix domain-containing protein [Bathymodiolus platifrons methanotrophic gill symbiont]|uniref:helix-turn-helix domain-containing protein n=1 Tax=Bathymodiolus platifrons methanotrophic gill symbiont TaxID=113268 RepID=UPI001124EB48|nr:helix-turn-helix domain-containing protein [Bathymodiolus platifrons methanotrophic gill symbiont]
MRKHMNQYKQLTEGQRYQISALLKVETPQKDIALILGVSPSTISRDLNVIQGTWIPP